MYHMHTFIVSKCMQPVQSGGFRFGSGLGTYFIDFWANGVATMSDALVRKF